MTITFAQARENRSRALAAGETTYVARSCKHGHVGVRVASNGVCVECRRDDQRTPEWKAANGKYRRSPGGRAADRERVRRYASKPEVRARIAAREKTPAYKAKAAAYGRRPEVRAARAARDRQRRATDPVYRLRYAVRTSVRAALFGRRKAARTLKLLDVPSIAWYKLFLERQFLPGMTWANYGTVWQIDHRAPLAAFDLSDPDHQRVAFRYLNTRPFWSSENAARGDRCVAADFF